MFDFAKPVTKLIKELNKLPGIGPKTAQRLAFHILDYSEKEVQGLTEAILEAKHSIKLCSKCCNLTDIDPCMTCVDENRDQEIICVVEDARDVAALERTREYKGLYHVLHGVISPMDNVGPEKLRIKELLQRIGNNQVKEIVMATNLTVEGEATAMYIARLINPFGIKVTRIAHGIPVGGDLEYADEVTLARAFEGRRSMTSV
ncbi:MAG: recombination protein RecR [Desulfitibacter sp. BRH_c19]|nr:MAG: recombination protein RecR [Desulfitibacter sp. BRH_c19]